MEYRPCEVHFTSESDFPPHLTWHACCSIDFTKFLISLSAEHRSHTLTEVTTMHNIDRTTLESGNYELPQEAFEYQEAGEFSSELYGGAPQEAGAFEMGLQGSEAFESPLQENEEIGLATEFLEISNEEELDHFLGGLIRRAGKALGKVARSQLARNIGSFLKPLAKAALPMVGKAIGTYFGGPVGGMVGGNVAPMAGQAFGLELQGMSNEDREYEVARRFVRFATEAARTALAAPPGTNPRAIAANCVVEAAKKFAPGLLRVATPMIEQVGPSSVPGLPSAKITGVARNRGQWYRHGNRIILSGV
jgi:hypothetical protein